MDDEIDQIEAENEIELISDDNGIAVIGDPSVLESFLSSQGLPSRELNLEKLLPAATASAAALKIGSEVAANSGRWVKLTKESAKALKTMSAMKGSQPGVVRAIMTSNGKTKHILQIVRGTGSFALNPAMLAGAAGIMAQLAMQQTMDEISEYLEVIDAKVDDVLRAQKDAAISEMIGAELEIDEAMSLRQEVGWVSDVTWSKVQSMSGTLKATQAYALRQLDAIVEKIEKQQDVGDLAKVISAIEPTAQEWLAVLARCFQLQDAMSILELDRVLTATPEELDRHRKGLALAREKRLTVIANHTERLIARVDQAAGTANAKVLFHPFKPRHIVQSSQRVVSGVGDFQKVLGIDDAHDSIEAKRWREAAWEVKDGAFDAGSDGAEVVGRFGSAAIRKARMLTAGIADQVAEVARVNDESDDRDAESNTGEEANLTQIEHQD